MTFNGGGKSFPVVYYDGERENILSVLSHKIGISSHQFSVFIADKNSNRKIPVTAKINLAAVSHDGGAEYIYVKRSRRSKKSLMKNRNLSEKLMHLRRDGSQLAYAVAPSLFKRVEMEKRIWNLYKGRDAAFLMSLEDTVECWRRGAPVGNGGGSGCAVCKECLLAEIDQTDADFHLCIRDEVVVGFRTRAGPVSRSVRSSDMVDSGENGG